MLLQCGQLVDRIDLQRNAAYRRCPPHSNGGFCLHTIIRGGSRVHLGISTGAPYLSEDGGETFTASNTGIGAGFASDPYPEFGQWVHKIARHGAAPGRL